MSTITAARQLRTATLNRTAKLLAALVDQLSPAARGRAWRREVRALQAAIERDRFVPLDPFDPPLFSLTEIGDRTVPTSILKPRPARGRHAAETSTTRRTARYGRAPVALAGYAARNGLRRPQDPAEAKGWLTALIATVPAAGVLLAAAVLTLVST